MANMSIYKASAPASFMIAGEHAVLHDFPAIVGTLNKRLQVAIEPRDDQQIVIHSSQLGDLTIDRHNIKASKPFQFVLAALAQYQEQLPSGATISIDSDFSHQLGFGSSAAVTVATIAAIKCWLGLTIDLTQLLREGRALIQRVQGLGSGADIAASIYGGVVHYDPTTLQVISFDEFPDASLIYVGYKTTTAEVIQQVEQRRQAQPQLYADYFALIGKQVEIIKQALWQQQWQDLATSFQAHHLLQHQLGTSDDTIELLRETLQQDPGITASKISGSGLGDCVLALGHPQQLVFPNHHVILTGLMQNDTPQGKSQRESGMYMKVHEHFEETFNTAGSVLRKSCLSKMQCFPVKISPHGVQCDSFH